MRDHDLKGLFKVRCVTGFGSATRLQDARVLLDDVKQALEALGYEVQMTRYSAQVVESFRTPTQAVIDAAKSFEAAATQAQVLPVNVGPISSGDVVRDSAFLTRLLTETREAFLSAAWGYADNWGYEEAKSLATAMFAAEEHTPGTNFRFCVSFNCQNTYIPFFPASCGGGNDAADRLGFSVGLENSALLHHAYECCDPSAPDPLRDLTKHVQRVFTEALSPIERVCQEVAGRLDVDFKGIDTSIAPDLRGRQHNMAQCVAIPGPGSGMQQPFQAGTVATIHSITSALRTLPGISTTGYRGVMLPVLENESLVDAVANKDLTVDKLLLYSTVCGVGLDVVPVAGGKTAAEREEAIRRLAGWLLDVAAISARCSKPLSVRVMPVFGTHTGERVSNFGNQYLIEGALAM